MEWLSERQKYVRDTSGSFTGIYPGWYPAEACGLEIAHCSTPRLISVPIVLFEHQMKLENEWFGPHFTPHHYVCHVRSSIPADLPLLTCRQPYQESWQGKKRLTPPLFGRSYQGFIDICIVKEALVRKKVGPPRHFIVLLATSRSFFSEQRRRHRSSVGSCTGCRSALRCKVSQGYDRLQLGFDVRTTLDFLLY